MGRGLPVPGAGLAGEHQAMEFLPLANRAVASIVCANRCATPAWRTTVENVCRNCRPGDAFRTRSPAPLRDAGVAATNVC